MRDRELIFKKIDDLSNVIHILEATANVYYCPNDKMWNVLLKARDSIKKHIDREQAILYREIDKIDKESER
jgi:hypothetical protein